VPDETSLVAGGVLAQVALFLLFRGALSTGLVIVLGVADVVKWDLAGDSNGLKLVANGGRFKWP
jgi:hypothetical protein